MYEERWEVKATTPAEHSLLVSKALSEAAETYKCSEQLPYYPFHRLGSEPLDAHISQSFDWVDQLLAKISKNQMSVIGFGICLLIHIIFHIYIVTVTPGTKGFEWISLAAIIIVSMSIILLIVGATNRVLWQSHTFFVTQYAVMMLLGVLLIFRFIFMDGLALLFKIAALRAACVVPGLLVQQTIFSQILTFESDLGLGLVAVFHVYDKELDGFKTQDVIGLLTYALAMGTAMSFSFGYSKVFCKFMHACSTIGKNLLVQRIVQREFQGQPDLCSQIIYHPPFNEEIVIVPVTVKITAEKEKDKNWILGGNSTNRLTSRVSLDPRRQINKINSRAYKNPIRGALPIKHSVIVPNKEYESSPVQRQFEEFLEHVGLSLLTDFKLNFLGSRKNSVRKIVEESVEQIKSDLSDMLEVKKKVLLKELWTRLVAEVLSQADLILVLDRVTFLNTEEVTPRGNSVKLLSVATGCGDSRALYIKWGPNGVPTGAEKRLNIETIMRSDSRISPKKSLAADSIYSLVPQGMDPKSVAGGSDWDLSEINQIRSNIKPEKNNRKAHFNMIDMKPQDSYSNESSPREVNRPAFPMDARQQIVVIPPASSEKEEDPSQVEQLISVVVHDMRTPLMCIQGNLELIDFELKQQGTNHELVEPLIKSSIAASTLLETLVNDILDAARISKGIFKISEAYMNLEETIHECLLTMEMAARSRNNVLELSFLDMEDRYIVSDKQRIKQVLLNFLSNSIKFTDNGNVVIKVDSAGDNIRISIEDNGRGIKKDQLDKLFEKFNSDRDARSNAKGLGLGLFICKSIVETLGPKNSIRVTSEPNVCTKISFELFKDVTKSPIYVRQKMPGKSETNPRAPGSGMNDTQNYHKRQPRRRKSMDIFEINDQGVTESRKVLEVRRKHKMSPVSKSEYSRFQTLPVNRKIREDSSPYLTAPRKQKNMTMKIAVNSVIQDLQSPPTDGELNILLLDDDDMIIELMQKFVEQAGKKEDTKIEHYQAQCIDRGLDLCKATEMDIVVTDFNLEDGTGPDFVKKLNQLGVVHKRPLFILLTGENIDSPKIANIRHLYFDILSKPVTFTVWLNVFRRCLDRLRSNPTGN